MSVSRHIRRVVPPMTYGGNVLLLLGWHDLARILVATVLAMLVLLYVLDCLCPVAKTTPE